MLSLSLLRLSLDSPVFGFHTQGAILISPINIQRLPIRVISIEITQLGSFQMDRIEITLFGLLRRYDPKIRVTSDSPSKNRVISDSAISENFVISIIER